MAKELYYPGYYEARQKVLQMSDEELLSLLDDLFGREKLGDEYSHDDLLQEALRQLKEEWMTPEGKEEMKYYDAVAKHFKRSRLVIGAENIKVGTQFNYQHEKWVVTEIRPNRDIVAKNAKGEEFGFDERVIQRVIDYYKNKE